MGAGSEDPSSATAKWWTRSETLPLRGPRPRRRGPSDSSSATDSGTTYSRRHAHNEVIGSAFGAPPRRQNRDGMSTSQISHLSSPLNKSECSTLVPGLRGVSRGHGRRTRVPTRLVPDEESVRPGGWRGGPVRTLQHRTCDCHRHRRTRGGRPTETGCPSGPSSHPSFFSLLSISTGTQVVWFQTKSAVPVTR